MVRPTFTVRCGFRPGWRSAPRHATGEGDGFLVHANALFLTDARPIPDTPKTLASRSPSGSVSPKIIKNKSQGATPEHRTLRLKKPLLRPLKPLFPTPSQRSARAVVGIDFPDPCSGSKAGCPRRCDGRGRMRRRDSRIRRGDHAGRQPPPCVATTPRRRFPRRSHFASSCWKLQNPRGTRGRLYNYLSCSNVSRDPYTTFIPPQDFPH